MILDRFILQGNMELYSVKLVEQEGYYQINNIVLLTM